MEKLPKFETILDKNQYEANVLINDQDERNTYIAEQDEIQSYRTIEQIHDDDN